MIVDCFVKKDTVSRERSLEIALASAAIAVVDALSIGLARTSPDARPTDGAFKDSLFSLISPAMSEASVCVRMCRTAALDEDLLSDPDSVVLQELLAPAVQTLSRLDPWDKEWALRYEALRDTAMHYIQSRSISQAELGDVSRRSFFGG